MFPSVNATGSLMEQHIVWDSDHAWQTLEFEMSLEVMGDSSAARAFASRRGMGRQNTCKNDNYGFRNEWQQDISQYKKKPRTLLRLENIGHNHLMLASALSLDQVQQFSCDKLAKSKRHDIKKMRSGSDVSYWMWRT